MTVVAIKSPVIYVSLPLNNSVINPPQLSSVCQQSSRSSPNSPCDNKCLNSNHINSKSNKLSSPLIPMLPPWNYPFINQTQPIVEKHEWQLLRLRPQLSRGVVRCLPWLFPVPLLWHLPRPFLERGMMNTILVCGDIVCLIFCLSMSIIRWEPNFWRDYCSHVSLYVPGIKIDYGILVSKSS